MLPVISSQRQKTQLAMLSLGGQLAISADTTTKVWGLLAGILKLGPCAFLVVYWLPSDGGGRQYMDVRKNVLPHPLSVGCIASDMMNKEWLW